jgi:putative ABC transport system permease protein
MMWKMAFRNLFRNKRRTIATGAAIVAGFVGLTLLGGYIYRVERGLRANSVYLLNKGHITIFKKAGLKRFATKPSYYQLTEADQIVLQNHLKKYADNIDWTGKALTGAGLISNGEKSVPFMAVGIDLVTLEKSLNSKEVQIWAKDFMSPETIHFIEAVKKDPDSISITSRLGEAVDRKSPFNKLPLEKRSVQLAGKNIYGDLNAVDAVLAVNHTTGSEMMEDSGLLAPYELLQSLYSMDGAHYVMIYLKDERKLKQMVAELNNVFKKENLDFEAYPFDDPDISANYVGTMGFLYAMTGFFVFLICGAVALSVVNSLTMGILERIREIGTFRAIGYRATQISWMMTQEALWLCLGSGILGISISAVIVVLIDKLHIVFSPPGVVGPVQFNLALNPMLISVISILFLSLVGITSFTVTHFKLKMKVVDLLSDAGA